MRWADKFAMDTFKASRVAGQGESEPEPGPRPRSDGERGRREREVELEIVPRRSRLGIEPPTHIDEWDAETVDEIPEAFEVDEPMMMIGAASLGGHDGERAPFHSAMLRPVRASAARAVRTAS
jgi:hypothetical protein